MVEYGKYSNDLYELQASRYYLMSVKIISILLSLLDGSGKS